MKYNEMSTIQVVQYINAELIKNRTMKEIEEVDFGENKGVIQKRLNRKGYVKINNQFVSAKENTTRDTTKILQQGNNYTTMNTTKILQRENKNTKKNNADIIQEKPSNSEGKKAFSSEEIDKLNRLLNLDINILDKMIHEYTTKDTTINTTNNIIDVKDKTTKVTSIRVNQELYNKIKEYSKENNINVGDIFNKMMMDFLMRNTSSNF